MAGVPRGVRCLVWGIDSATWRPRAIAELRPECGDFSCEFEDARLERTLPAALPYQPSHFTSKIVDLICPAVLMRDLARLGKERPSFGGFAGEICIVEPCAEFDNPAFELIDEHRITWRIDRGFVAQHPPGGKDPIRLPRPAVATLEFRPKRPATRGAICREHLAAHRGDLVIGQLSNHRPTLAGIY